MLYLVIDSAFGNADLGWSVTSLFVGEFLRRAQHHSSAVAEHPLACASSHPEQGVGANVGLDTVALFKGFEVLEYGVAIVVDVQEWDLHHTWIFSL